MLDSTINYIGTMNGHFMKLDRSKWSPSLVGQLLTSTECDNCMVNSQLVVKCTHNHRVVGKTECAGKTCGKCHDSKSNDNKKCFSCNSPQTGSEGVNNIFVDDIFKIYKVYDLTLYCNTCNTNVLIDNVDDHVETCPDSDIIIDDEMSPDEKTNLASNNESTREINKKIKQSQEKMSESKAGEPSGSMANRKEHRDGGEINNEISKNIISLLDVNARSNLFERLGVTIYEVNILSDNNKLSQLFKRKCEKIPLNLTQIQEHLMNVSASPCFSSPQEFIDKFLAGASESERSIKLNPKELDAYGNMWVSEVLQSETDRRLRRNLVACMLNCEKGDLRELLPFYSMEHNSYFYSADRITAEKILDYFFHDEIRMDGIIAMFKDSDSKAGECLLDGKNITLFDREYKLKNIKLSALESQYKGNERASMEYRIKWLKICSELRSSLSFSGFRILHLLLPYEPHQYHYTIKKDGGLVRYSGLVGTVNILTKKGTSIQVFTNALVDVGIPVSDVYKILTKHFPELSQ